MLMQAQQLTKEIERFQKDHSAVMKIKKDLETSKRRLDEEKAAWEKLKVDRIGHRGWLGRG